MQPFRTTKYVKPSNWHLNTSTPKSMETNMHSKNTKIAATKYRLNQEIRFLYCKKQKLNEQL